MKILLGWFGHETNTFSRVKTDYNLLTSQGYWEGEEILDVFRDSPSYLGGMIKYADENGIDLIPTYAVENAGPTLSDECVEFVLWKLGNYIKKHIGEFEGICLGLHGAGCSETIDDIETYTLKYIRDIVGDEMPITITLDLHGNVTKEMSQMADGMFGIKKNPHVDYAITGYEAMQALIRHINKEIKLETHVVPLPMLVPITQTDDYKDINQFIIDYKKKHGLLDLAFFPGFPYSDTKYTKATVFVTGDGDQSHHAKHVAKVIWDKRDKIVDVSSLDFHETMDLAKEYLATNDSGICVINEASDNPGAGTPGDGTGLLKEFVEANIPRSAFGYIFDPDVVNQAVKAGVGSRININLGGKIEDEGMHGMPLYLEDVKVVTISDGNFISTTPLMYSIPGSFGKTVGLKYKNVIIVVASVQNQTYDDRSFFVGGVDIAQMRLLGLKSSQHFKAFYDDIADKIIPANGSGLSTKNIKLFDYKKVERPIYPLDDDVSFNI